MFSLLLFVLLYVTASTLQCYFYNQDTYITNTTTTQTLAYQITRDMTSESRDLTSTSSDKESYQCERRTCETSADVMSRDQVTTFYT